MSNFHAVPRNVTRDGAGLLDVGIIGFGYASATFHAPLIKATSGLRLAAVASTAPERVRQALPDVDVCPGATSLYERTGIKLVVIATPNQTHYPLALEALEAGKHVVIDKPFALDAVQARELVELAERKSLLLSVFHNRRWDGDFLTLRQLIDEGVLGRIVHFESHFDRYRPVTQQRWRESSEPGSGLWYDLGSHLVDQTLQLFGKPAAIWLDVANQRDGVQADDWFHAVLHYGSMRTVLHASALTVQPAPRFTVHGTHGSYVKHGLDMQESVLRAGGTICDGWARDTNSGSLIFCTENGLAERKRRTLPGAYSGYYAQMREAILFGEPVPVTARSALEVVEVLDAGIKSTRQGMQVSLR
jgi:predicted dehydrogenase